MEAVRNARTGLVLFLCITFPLSFLVEWWIIHRTFNRTLLVLLLMWIPGLVSLLLRAVRGEGFADISFEFAGWRGGRACVAAWLFPLAVGLLAYGAAWLSGIAAFAPADAFGDPVPGPRLLAFASLIGGALFFGFVENMFSAAGEEIGWRGYMLERLVISRVPRPVLVSGLIWCVWHLPLIIGLPRAPLPDRLIGAALFTACILPIAAVMAWQRFGTGSVWPAIVLHASWNSLILEAFDPSAQVESSVPWLGETGILVAAVNITLALLIAVLPWKAWLGFSMALPVQNLPLEGDPA